MFWCILKNPCAFFLFQNSRDLKTNCQGRNFCVKILKSARPARAHILEKNFSWLGLSENYYMLGCWHFRSAVICTQSGKDNSGNGSIGVCNHLKPLGSAKTYPPSTVAVGFGIEQVTSSRTSNLLSSLVLFEMFFWNMGAHRARGFENFHTEIFALAVSLQISTLLKWNKKFARFV